MRIEYLELGLLFWCISQMNNKSCSAFVPTLFMLCTQQSSSSAKQSMPIYLWPRLKMSRFLFCIRNSVRPGKVFRALRIEKFRANLVYSRDSSNWQTAHVSEPNSVHGVENRRRHKRTDTRHVSDLIKSCEMCQAAPIRHFGIIPSGLTPDAAAIINYNAKCNNKNSAGKCRSSHAKWWPWGVGVDEYFGSNRFFGEENEVDGESHTWIQ